MEKNPLDIVRGLNIQKEEEQQAQKSASLEEQKSVLSKDIEDLKKKIEGIKGSREEMIAQYHEVINEAKKNPETLKYVRDHFQELFKDGIEKWQGLRDELNLFNQSKEEDTKKLESLQEQIKNVFLEASVDGEIDKEESVLKSRIGGLDSEIRRKTEDIELIKENIQDTISLKQKYSNILSQKVELMYNQNGNTQAKIISKDSIEFTKQAMQLPYPFYAGAEEELKKRGYSENEIRNYQRARKELNDLGNKISEDFPGATRTTRTSTDSQPAFWYIPVGHGRNSFDKSLVGKEMTLSELIDAEINIKSKKLEEAVGVLEKTKKEKEALLK